jgi:hypothetical protein
MQIDDTYVMTITIPLKVLFLLFINNKELIDHPTHYTSL